MVEWSPKATGRGFIYYVYVLKSLKNGRIYTGSTNNLERRFYEHNAGHSKYTKSTAPFMLVYREEFETREEAYKREMYFKTGKGREEIKNILMRW